MEFEQKNIIFGDGKTWKDVEADEACFDKTDITNDVQFQHLIKEKDTTLMWEQWAGVVPRCFPKSLVLRRLDPKLTVKRTPGHKRFLLFLNDVCAFNNSIHRHIEAQIAMAIAVLIMLYTSCKLLSKHSL